MTKDFEEWAKEMKYNLDKEKYESEKFNSAWIYKNTHTQSAWQAWNAALTLYWIDEEPVKFNEGEEA
jgi:hypothetical protein